MAIHVVNEARRCQTAASVREVDYAKADGVEFYYGMRPTRITDDGVYYKKVEMDEEGNITSTSEEQFFPCSSVIIAISQGAQNRIVSTTTGLEMSSHGLLATDEHGHTTREGIFASGDVVLGARTVVEAVKYSKQVAEEMDEYLTKRREKETPREIIFGLRFRCFDAPKVKNCRSAAIFLTLLARSPY